MNKSLFYLTCFFLLLGLVLTNAAKASDPNLVGWWKLDGDANDSSGYGLNGIVHGAVTYVAGPTYGANLPLYTGNSAITLSGVADQQQYAELPSGVGTVMSKLTDCTFAFWVNYRQTGGGNRNQRFFDFGTSITNYVSFRPRRSSSVPTFFEISTTSGVIQRVSYGPYPTGGTVIPTYTWTHLAVTIDDVNNIFRLYVNGQQVGEANGTNATLAPIDVGVTTSNWLGRSIDPGVEGPYLPGYLDDFRIYNRTLKVEEVRQVMGYPIATFPTPADGAVLAVGTTAVNLAWAKGANAAAVNGSHLYLGNNWDDVNDGKAAVDKGFISGSTYTVTNLVQDITYYWRVDTIDQAGTVYKGNIWSFMIQPRIAWTSTPADRALYIAPKMTLRWKAGTGAALGHNVYLSDNLDQVTNAPTGSTALPFRIFLAPTVSDPNWTPANSGVALAVNKTYYWRVDEVESQTPAVIYQGQVWRFTTVPSGPPITEPNLVGWWKLDNDVIDSSLGCNGTEIGGPTYDAGYFGSSIFINNVNNPDTPDDIYANLPVGSVISTLTNSTFAIWAYYLGTETSRVHQRFFSFSTVPANSMYLAPRVSVSAPTHFQIATGGVTQMVGYGSNASNAGTIIPTNEWHHLAVTINADSDTFTLYLDGQQVGSLTAATLTPSNLGLTTNNWLGRSENPSQQRQYQGYLDDFRIYDKVLTPTEIQQLMVRLTASDLYPHHRDPNVSDSPTLRWLAGEKAAQHDVYFGSDEAAVGTATTATAGIYRGRQALDQTTYVLPEAPLNWGQAYYLRIDEIEANGAVHPGNVWIFTTANFLVVDNFETYNNVDNKIYDTWIDYYVNKTGMTVGHLTGDFAERTTFRSGRQAMYMRYDNDGTVNEGTSYLTTGTLPYSETDREWSAPQNWKRNNGSTLRLYFRGMPPLYGSFIAGPPTWTLTARGTDITGTADQFHFAFQKLSGNGSIIAKVDSLTNTNAAAKAGLMMREDVNDAGSAYVAVVITPSSGVLFRYRSTAGGATTQAVAQTGITAPRWLKLERNVNTFTASYSTNGTDWTAMTTTVTTPMLIDLYIGFCLSSVNVNSPCTAVFSNLTTSGTGPWANKDIGIQSNSADPIYVVLQDSAGISSPPVIYSNQAATTLTTYTPWNIPLTQFGNVNMEAIKKMTIGVGVQGNTQLQPGHAGDIYIDDIGVYPP
ncbi:MAG: LamG domain-containing protein [Sedimentisphaerales bacterium]|nr:LamG domain-containing protein [Sedimentisphaerales bacterium]